MNGPRSKDEKAWELKKYKLIEQWIKAGLYNPRKTWSKAATNAGKIKMVVLTMLLSYHTLSVMFI